MNYDFTNRSDRKRFVKRANKLLKDKRTNVSLVDESNRTLHQNSYLHVLCRIMACETGVTERYAKDVYFKQLANPDIFVTTTKDSVSGKMVVYTKSTCDISIDEMRKAITNFIQWAAENGYTLPAANIDDEWNAIFASDTDKEMFHQAQIETSKQEQFL